MDPQNSRQSADRPNSRTPQESQSAAANVIRSQIDALYSREPIAPAPRDKDNINPYDRTHKPHPKPQAEQWKEYHSAWQTYYQKYYEAYYVHQQAQQRAKQEVQPHPQPEAQQSTGADQPGASKQAQSYFSSHTDLDTTTEELSRNQALFELRQKLRSKVHHRAKKIRGSKHFIPIAAALSVVLIFGFLQYNRVLIASVNAYVSPGSIDPQNIVIEPGSSGVVAPDPRLIIPKINVDVPAIYDVGNDYASQMKAMENGVAHFAIPGASSHPGEIGNTVLSGHSSNDLFDAGDYKFIFAQLDKLAVGDTIYANYQSKRYTYVVTKKEVVKPTEVSKLVYPTDKPVMTLITCTPLGTAIDRLLITAEQVSPDPSAAAAAPAGSGQTSDNSAAIPGNSPTLFERLFGTL